MFDKRRKYMKILYRLILFLLSAALVLPAAILIAGAEELTGKVSVNAARFCTEEISVENAGAKINSDGTLTISADGSSPKISMAVVPVKAETRANALRVVIKNTSNLDSMNVEYIYKNSAQISEHGLASVALKKGTSHEEYIIPVDYADSMTHLVFAFNGNEKATGDIDIISIAAISYYFDNREYFGTMIQNSYDSDTKTAEFSGSVAYETTLAYPDGQIVLYRLEQDELIEDVRFVHPYVASCPMTLSFKFTFEIKSTADICSRYFAAILTKDDSIIPLTPETYLKNKNSIGAEDAESGDVGFKGIETSLYAGASENGTPVAFVDVLLNKLISSSGDGFQYVLGEGKEYYFDRSYIAELDARIRSHSLAGSAVYLRFLVDSYDRTFGYLKNPNVTENIKYFAINPCSDEIVDNIYACADFIVSRYTSEEFGSLQGVILGRSLDNAAMYNYCGSVSMSDYADMLARLCSIIKCSLDRTEKAVEILLPMSDSFVGTDVLMDSDTRDKHYPSDLLAESVLKMLDRYGVDLSSLYFMLESEHLPALVADGNEADPNEFIGADNITVFTDTVKRLSEKYTGLPKDILFCWFPGAKLSSGELLASYMYNYNVLACTSGIRSYIISIFERNESIISDTESVTAEKNIFSLIKSTYKYADTFNNSAVSAAALSATGKDNWTEVIEGYDPSKVIKRTLIESNAEYSVAENTVGIYRMWDFSDANGLHGWSMSDGCSSLSVYTPSSGLSRALVAGFNGDTGADCGADYGSVIYKSEGALLMKGISRISFELVIPAELSKNLAPGEVFEVKITLGSDTVTSETVGLMKSDSLTSVYADISAVDEVDYIKISLRSLDGEAMSDVKLCINSVSIHSDIYNDEELENIVLSGELMGKDNTAISENADVLIVIGSVICLSILAVVACWGIFFTWYKKRSC